MERSPHVMLAGAGAETFARALGIEAVPPSHFFDAHRWRALEEFLTRQGMAHPPRPPGVPGDTVSMAHDEGARGTVGAVARDRQGHLAAATSTGGITGKRWGRVGDSPIIGAGCYASDASCAVSCTGTGEAFIRLVLAHAIVARIALLGESLEAAGTHVIGELARLGGTGGIIAVGRAGSGLWRFNTQGMYRARIAENAPLQAALYGEEG
jgi:beta-aspartyl-peptidase (threonine type)